MTKTAAPDAALPAYERVKAFIKAQVNLGVWRPGAPVPSEAVLQQQFGISRSMMDELAAESHRRLMAEVADLERTIAENLAADRFPPR